VTPRFPHRLCAAVAALALAAAGCGHDTGGLGPAPGNTDPVVFDDNYGNGVGFQAFAGSKVTAVTVDLVERHQGTASLQVVVPAPGDPEGGYAGGAFTTVQPRDPSVYNALTFWARASRPASLDVAGLGNDNTGTSRYEAKSLALPLTTTWTKYVIPIPRPEVLRSERGMFFFAEGPEAGAGYTLWFDDIRFENLPTIANPRPALATRTLGTFVGAALRMEGTRTTFDVGGADQVVEHSPGYFTFTSSNEAVARVEDGLIRVVAGGTADITAKLDTVTAFGTVTIQATALPPAAAPDPTVPAADVISLFSDVYADVQVDTWSAPWDLADVADVQVAGNDVKGYTNLVYAGVEFVSQPIDATAMTHFHVDAWAASGAVFRVKLVDFGADGVFGGGDDREQELGFNGGTTPAFRVGQWSSLEIPLSSFTGLTTRAHLAQLILSGDPGTVYIDNVYFHR
jgi:hypothetical protein